MSKKFFSLLLVAFMLFSAFAFAGCDDASTTESGESDNFKIGVILIGDDSEGYSLAHMNGIKQACSELGIKDDQVIWKYRIAQDANCEAAAKDLVSSGCNVIFSNSYGHQDYMVKVAKENPTIQFVAVTGDFAAICGADNLSNAFTYCYEGRYMSGLVAGMKLKELVDNGTLTKEAQPNSFDENGNIKIGYVGAYNFAEVVSGYTAFYLGIKSVVSNVVMDVQYTNSWSDLEAENSTAKALIANGCVIICQHADTTGAPSACEEANKDGKVVFSVGYNIDMLSVAPNAALTSATNNWNVYYKYAINAAKNGEKIAKDWASGFKDDAVGITTLGKSCAAGTQEAVDKAIADIKAGTLHVFDINNFTVGGEKVTTAKVDLSYMDFSKNPPAVVYQGEEIEAIKDGYFQESVSRAAPYFALRIDGITEKN